MEKNSEAGRIKQKILGVLIRKARTQAGLKLEEIAQKMGLAADKLNDYELGQQEASLPELEALARLFGIPVQYFWSNGAQPASEVPFQAQKMISVRRKMIGVLLRQARLDAGHDEAALAAMLKVTPEQIRHYELGQAPIPFSELEALASFLDLPLSYFLDEVKPQPDQPEPAATAAPPPVAVMPTSASATTPAPMWLEDLPDEVKDFLADPSSMLYLKLSMRLHNLSADTLRALAEGILDITY
jgi:transcriptional regulator with XRE-family HTH domain